MEKGHLWSSRVKVLWLTMYLSLKIIFYANIFSLTADCEPWKFLGENGNVCQKCPIGAKPRWCSEFKMNFFQNSVLHTKKAQHLDRGLFKIFRYLLVAKTSKNDTNIICRSLKKKYFFLNLKTVAQKLCQLCSFHVWSSQRHGSLYISAIPIYSYGLLLMYSY